MLHCMQTVFSSNAHTHTQIHNKLHLTDATPPMETMSGTTMQTEAARVFQLLRCEMFLPHLQGTENLHVGMADVGNDLGEPNEELIGRQLVYQLLDYLHQQTQSMSRHLAIEMTNGITTDMVTFF